MKESRQDYDEELTHIMNHFVQQEVSEFGVMDKKTEALVILAALTATHTLRFVGRTVERALNHGATVTEIKETLYQTAPYIGFARVFEALDIVNTQLLDAGISPIEEGQSSVNEDTRFEKGLSVQQQIFGEANINEMRASAPDETKHIQDFLSANCFGDYYTRKTLDLKMRELITFVAIISLGGCEPQAKAHAKANISVGNTKQTLIEAVTKCLPYIGYPRTLNALNCINEACQ